MGPPLHGAGAQMLARGADTQVRPYIVRGRSRGRPHEVASARRADTQVSPSATPYPTERSRAVGFDRAYMAPA